MLPMWRGTSAADGWGMTTDNPMTLSLSVEIHRRELMAEAATRRLAGTARVRRARRREVTGTDGGC